MTALSWFKVLAITLGIQIFLAPFMWGECLGLKRITMGRRIAYGMLFGPLFLIFWMIFRPTATEVGAVALLCGAAAFAQGIALVSLYKMRHKSKTATFTKPVALILTYGILALGFAILALYFSIHQQSNLLGALFLIAACLMSILIITRVERRSRP